MEIIPDWMCDIHMTQMEWVPSDDYYAYPEGGYWFCEECWLDDEADFDAEHSDFEEDDKEIYGLVEFEERGWG